MQARDTFESCGLQSRSFNDVFQAQIERIEDKLGQVVNEQVKTTQELDFVAKRVQKQIEQPRQSFGKEEASEKTPKSSSELSSIILEVTRPHTPRILNAERQWVEPDFVNIGQDEQLLAHR